MLYDNADVRAYTPAPTPEPTPAPTPEPTPAPSGNYAEADFEAVTDDNETIDGWKYAVNVFTANADGTAGAYEYNYLGAAPNASHPNQSQISAVERSETDSEGNATNYL